MRGRVCYRHLGWPLKPVRRRQSRRAEKTVNDLHDILRQLFLKGRVFALVEDHDLDLLRFTNGEHQCRAKAQESICVRDDEPPDAVGQDIVEQPTSRVAKRLIASDSVIVDCCSNSSTNGWNPA